MFWQGDLQLMYNDNSFGRLGIGVGAAIYQKTTHFFWALGQAFFSQKVNFSELTFTELNSII